MGLKIAVTGLGIGKAHVAALAEHVDRADVVAVCDVNRAHAEEVAGTCGAQAFDDFAAMLDQARPEAVVLATPPKFHAQQTALAAERGIHVLCEKPMAPNLADCEHMIRACADAGVTLQIGFKKRFYASYRRVRTLVQESGAPLLWANVRFALGRVEKDWFWDEENGGGPLLENAVHEYDILQFLMGEVRSAYAAGGNLFMGHRKPQLDAAGAVLTFASGGVASMGIGYGSEWGFTRELLALSSSALAIEMEGPFDRPFSLRYVWREKPGEVLTEDIPVPEQTFVPQLEHFVDCVQDGATCEAPGEAGLAAVNVALAVKKSIREGCVIDLDSP